MDFCSSSSSRLRNSAALRSIFACAFLACVSALAQTQAPTPAQPEPSQPAPQQPPAAPQGPSVSPTTHTENHTAQPSEPSITEDELKQQLESKTFYLRGGYLENTLHFNDHGALDGSSPQASYTLSLVEINRVHLDKHHLELEGVRYGLHFLGALPSEDQTQAVDKVRLTTKKKPLKITIDREEVVAPKKEKPEKEKKGKSSSTQANQTGSATAVQPAPATAVSTANPQDSERHGVEVTTSQAHANQALRTSLDKIFSPGIDDRMIATLPDYWRLFYKAVATKSEYRPGDASIYRQNQVDKKAHLVSVFEPPSNEYAQNNGVAGMAMYHVVVSPDGKPMEIAVGRPIGFGLDESAVAAIRKATFDPAMKDGKPVPVVLDLVVQFRIYSHRTAAASQAASPVEAAKTASAPSNAPILPGPYTANEPKPQPDPQAQPAAQPDAPSQPQPPAQPTTQPEPETQPVPPAQPQPQPPPQQPQIQ